jgi:hypothetical protein
MSTIEAANQDQAEAKRDPKVLEAESFQKTIEIINNNGNASNSDRKNIEELLELLKSSLTQLEEPLISHSLVERLANISDLDQQPFKHEIMSLIHDNNTKSVLKCCSHMISDPLNKINSVKLSALLTPIMLDISGLSTFELINKSINCSRTIARMIEHYPYLFKNIELENGSGPRTSNDSEELSHEELNIKLLENKKIIEKLQLESEIKSSLIEVLVNKVDVLEKQEKMSATASDLSKSDVSYHGMNSNEGLSDDESQKSEEMPHIKINDNYLSHNTTGHMNGHLSLPVSPMKIDPSQDWTIKEKKYQEHIRKLENKLNSTQTKKRKEELERLRRKLVESEQQRRTLSNDLKNLQKQVQMSQRKSSSASSTANSRNNSKKIESQSSSSGDQSYDSVSKNDTFDINAEKAKDNIEVKMLTIDEEEYTNLQYLLFTWMVVALKLTAMAEGKSPQNIDKQTLFQKAMDDRLDYASWPALIMEHIK